MPRVGSSAPFKIFKSVVFPEPFSPTWTRESTTRFEKIQSSSRLPRFRSRCTAHAQIKSGSNLIDVISKHVSTRIRLYTNSSATRFLFNSAQPSYSMSGSTGKHYKLSKQKEGRTQLTYDVTQSVTTPLLTMHILESSPAEMLTFLKIISPGT